MSDDRPLGPKRSALSVVVATRDRPVLLQGCLHSLKAALQPGDELIVVDSASRESDAISEIGAAHDATYMRCDQPGASRARNLGWRAAAGEVVAFIDDDARVFPGWRDAVIAAFAEASGLGFVTGRIDHPDPSKPVERPVAIFDRATSFDIGAQTVEPFGHGANHAVRRRLLNEVGGFDERLGPGAEFPAAEDLDLWDRLVLAGHLGRYVPEMGGWHVQWRGRRDSLGLDWSYGYGGGVRLSKLLRSDRRRAARSAKVLFWIWGLSEVPEHVRAGRRFMAMLDVVRVAGGVVGVLRGIGVPLDEGYLAPRGARLSRARLWRRRRLGAPRDDQPAGPR